MNNCFYEAIILQKKVFKIDRLRLLSESMITAIVLFTETELSSTENILKLRNLTLSENEDYISMLEVLKE